MYAEKYLGFANENKVFVTGRILQDPIIIPKDTQSKWTPLYNNFRRFISREKKHFEFYYRANRRKYRISTDHEGYYHIEPKLKSQLDNKSRIDHLSMQINGKNDKHPYLLPSKNAKFGLISDVDDTILKSHVFSLFKMLYLTFAKNPWKRDAVEHAVIWFEQMSEDGQNPTFYVSNSPWNIYSNIHKFLEISGFPAGPTLLRDYGFYVKSKPKTYTEHKLISIRKILSFYPELPFYLIGDAAEKDAEFYQQIYQEFPGKIKRIYIRKASTMTQDLQVYENLEYFTFFKSFHHLLN